jgi:hypothetical protein
MENSDKQLRDKLSGNEFPFDPQAWEQMEAMLDGRKKRRGFFWWWTGGIAAALVCGVVGYVAHDFVGGNTLEKAQITANTSTPEINQQPLVANSTYSQTTENKNQSVVAPANRGTYNTAKKEVQENGLTTYGKTKNSDKRSFPKTRKKNANPSVEAQERNKPAGQQVTAKHTGLVAKKRVKNSGYAGLKRTGPGRRKAASILATGSAATKVVVNAQQEVQALNTAGNKTTEENLTLARREGFLFAPAAESTITTIDKTANEDQLPQSRKKIVQYSLGIAANITGATLGKQQAATDYKDKAALFNSKPSYMAGFTHDFLFINRVAITNSFLYSQTSFKVSAPKSVSYARSPVSYTSTIAELAIPIGIKVYPVVKPHFRFYINTGIINHIKLKETFSYNMPLDTPVANMGSGQNDPYSLPNQTDFEPGTKTADVLGVTSNGGVATTRDFSINNAKRYYASFYASAGAEFIVKSHWTFFTEPLFYMNLQKIGVQDKRKYNLGLTGGIRYQF